MNKNQWTWLYELFPQTFTLPFVYLGTKDMGHSILYEFWMSCIMIYVLYVTFSKLHQATNKEELAKVERTIYSGWLGYVFLTCYITIAIVKEGGFAEQWFIVVPLLLLQALQYLIIFRNYQKMKEK